MASESVLIRIMAKMVYSNTGDVTKAHSLYWTGFLGMYRRTGFAFNANSMQLRWNADDKS